MKNYSKKYRYGSIIELNGKRLKGFSARITLGYDNKGYPIYHFLGTFEEELDAHLCLRDYNNKPFGIYISEEKYKKISGTRIDVYNTKRSIPDEHFSISLDF